MSALKFSGQFVEAHPFPKMVRTYTTIATGEIENLAHGGKSGARVHHINARVTVPATSGDPLTFTHIKANDSTTNDTCQVQWDSIPGGDLAGMEAELEFVFLDVGTADDLEPFES